MSDVNIESLTAYFLKYSYKFQERFFNYFLWVTRCNHRFFHEPSIGGDAIAVQHAFGNALAFAHDATFIKGLSGVRYAHGGLAMVSETLIGVSANVQSHLPEWFMRGYVLRREQSVQ
ncbi:MAG: hypothetical protein ABS75_29245 [Pelagibacterium sp. SCN 63-23]|nr:MAG: hypothetical protein ABS75_29245 [Pelagibacterium sp. SCN 63-23]